MTNPVMLKFGENLLHLLIVLSLTQIQQWICEEQLFEIKLQRLCHGNPSMNFTTTPSIFGKCNSLTTKPMMLKFGKKLLHLLNNNHFKFDTNPTMDLEGTTKNPEVFSWTHKTNHGLDSGEATTFFHIVSFASLYDTYIQMAFCPETPKEESRNCPGLDSRDFASS